MLYVHAPQVLSSNTMFALMSSFLSFFSPLCLSPCMDEHYTTNPFAHPLHAEGPAGLDDVADLLLLYERDGLILHKQQPYQTAEFCRGRIWYKQRHPHQREGSETSPLPPTSYCCGCTCTERQPQNRQILHFVYWTVVAAEQQVKSLSVGSRLFCGLSFIYK